MPSLDSEAVGTGFVGKTSMFGFGCLAFVFYVTILLVLATCGTFGNTKLQFPEMELNPFPSETKQLKTTVTQGQGHQLSFLPPSFQRNEGIPLVRGTETSLVPSRDRPILSFRELFRMTQKQIEASNNATNSSKTLEDTEAKDKDDHEDDDDDDDEALVALHQTMEFTQTDRDAIRILSDRYSQNCAYARTHPSMSVDAQFEYIQNSKHRFVFSLKEQLKRMALRDFQDSIFRKERPDSHLLMQPLVQDAFEVAVERYYERLLTRQHTREIACQLLLNELATHTSKHTHDADSTVRGARLLSMISNRLKTSSNVVQDAQWFEYYHAQHKPLFGFGDKVATGTKTYCKPEALVSFVLDESFPIETLEDHPPTLQHIQHRAKAAAL